MSLYSAAVTPPPFQPASDGKTVLNVVPAGFAAFQPGAEVNFNPKQQLSSAEFSQWTLAQRLAKTQRSDLQHIANWTSAIQLLNPLLEAHPEFLEARKTLRLAQVNLASTRGFLKRNLPPAAALLPSAEKLLNAGRALAALHDLEIRACFHHPAEPKVAALGHRIALAAGLPATATHFLQTIVDCHPNDIDAKLILAEHFMQIGDPSQAGLQFENILKIDPHHIRALEGKKNAAAANLMLNGDDIPLRDASNTLRLQQEERTGLTADQMAQEVTAIRDAYAATPHDHSTQQRLRRAARFAEQIAEQFPDDVSWYPVALDLYQILCGIHPGDSALAENITRIEILIAGREITSLRKELTTGGSASDDVLESELAEKVAAYNQQRLAFFSGKVARSSNDQTAKCGLAEVHLDMGHFDEVIPLCQQAATNPSVEARARLIWSRALQAKNIYDLAERQLREAIRANQASPESVAQRRMTNQLAYELASLLSEHQSNPDEARTLLEGIWSRDPHFRNGEVGRRLGFA
jgi:tetratricopeptide (TPR) repeat protein